MSKKTPKKSTQTKSQADLKDEFIKAVQDLPPMPKVVLKIQELLFTCTEVGNRHCTGSRDLV